jgi:hypothetical protein
MGLKKTSEVIAVSFSVTETAANTYTQQQVNLSLDVLNNEVFIVTAVDLDPSSPDAVAGTDTSVSSQLTSTSQTAAVNLSNSNCIASFGLAIKAAGFAPGGGGVGFTRTSLDSPPATLDYIGIIATDNFFVAINGAGNTGAKTLNGRVWGYRARADASTYAALVQSEVLSS